MTGGLLGERLLVSGLVHAQKPNGVNAEVFLLLDQWGKPLAGLGREPNPGLIAGWAGGYKTHGPLRSGIVVGA